MNQKTAKTAINGPTANQPMIMIFEALGYDTSDLSVEAKQDVAHRLSQMAGRCNGDAWQWRYIHNVVTGKMAASREMISAIEKLGASIDGTPDVLAKATRVTVLAAGTVKPGSLILADSIRCANPACGIWFVPKAHNQRYHSLECKRAWERCSRRRK